MFPRRYADSLDDGDGNGDEGGEDHNQGRDGEHSMGDGNDDDDDDDDDDDEDDEDVDTYADSSTTSSSNEDTSDEEEKDTGATAATAAAASTCGLRTLTQTAYDGDSTAAQERVDSGEDDTLTREPYLNHMSDTGSASYDTSAVVDEPRVAKTYSVAVGASLSQKVLSKPASLGSSPRQRGRRNLINRFASAPASVPATSPTASGESGRPRDVPGQSGRGVQRVGGGGGVQGPQKREAFGRKHSVSFMSEHGQDPESPARRRGDGGRGRGHTTQDLRDPNYGVQKMQLFLRVQVSPLIDTDYCNFLHNDSNLLQSRVLL